MPFTQPQPFTEALESRQARTILPTSLRTAELDQLAPAIRERALFSAGVTQAEFLQELGSTVDDMLEGNTSLADARVRMQAFLQATGQDTGDRLSGDLQDLSSIRRLNITLQTNAQMARGHGQYVQANTEGARLAYPAQELVRVTPSRVPRDWPARWQQAGGKLYQGRMIARKDDPVWAAISRFGTPYPPYDFNSGMGVRPIDRETAANLRVITLDDAPPPAQSRKLNETLQAAPAVRDAALQASLLDQIAREGLSLIFRGGVLRPA